MEVMGVCDLRIVAGMAQLACEGFAPLDGRYVAMPALPYGR